MKQLVHDQADLVAGLYFRAEVHFPLEDFGGLCDQVLTLGLARKRVPQRALNLSCDGRLARFEFELFHSGRIRVCLFFDPQYAFVVDLVFEGLECTVTLFFEAKWISKPELANIEHGLDKARHFIRHRCRYVVIHQCRDQCPVLSYGVFDDFSFRKEAGGRGKLRNRFDL